MPSSAARSGRAAVPVKPRGWRWAVRQISSINSGQAEVDSEAAGNVKAEGVNNSQEPESRAALILRVHELEAELEKLRGGSADVPEASAGAAVPATSSS